MNTWMTIFLLISGVFFHIPSMNWSYFNESFRILSYSIKQKFIDFQLIVERHCLSDEKDKVHALESIVFMPAIPLKILRSIMSMPRIGYFPILVNEKLFLLNKRFILNLYVHSKSFQLVQLFCDPMDWSPFRPSCPWDFFSDKVTGVGCRFSSKSVHVFLISLPLALIASHLN